MADSNRAFPADAGRATHERSRVAPSPPTVSVPNAGWQHVLEDGSFDHEWVTEGGVTFCAQCEVEQDYDK